MRLSRQGSRIKIDAEEVKEVGVVTAGIFSAAFEGTLGQEFVGFEQVEAPSAQGGEVFGGMLESGAALIFVEDDVEDPVQLIFDTPMAANGVAKALSASIRVTNDLRS